jgi:hypothetical protein
MPFQLPIEPIILAIATLAGALIGSLSQFILRWRSRMREKENLRSALQAEIKQLNNHLEPTDYSISRLIGMTERREILPTSIFDSNTSEIGRLSQEEVVAITEFYTELRNLRGAAKDAQKGDAEHRESIQIGMKETRELGKEAVSTIEENK